MPASNVDPLKYQSTTRPTRAAASGELLTVKVRYKAPDGDACGVVVRGYTSRLLSQVLMNRASGMTANIGFASAVAEFGMVLRESPDRGSASFLAAAERARRFRGEDTDGYRAEFVTLVERAVDLRGRDEYRQQSRR